MSESLESTFGLMFIVLYLVYFRFAEMMRLMKVRGVVT